MSTFDDIVDRLRRLVKEQENPFQHLGVAADTAADRVRLFSQAYAIPSPYFVDGGVSIRGYGSMTSNEHSYWGKIGDSIPPGDGITVVRWDGE